MLEDEVLPIIALDEQPPITSGGAGSLRNDCLKASTGKYCEHSRAYFCGGAGVVCEIAVNSDSVTESVTSGCDSVESVLIAGPISGTCRSVPFSTRPACRKFYSHTSATQLFLFYTFSRIFQGGSVVTLSNKAGDGDGDIDQATILFRRDFPLREFVIVSTFEEPKPQDIDEILLVTYHSGDASVLGKHVSSIEINVPFE